MRRHRNGSLAVTLLLAVTATAGAEAGHYNSGASKPNAEIDLVDEREVTRMRDGCETLLDQESDESAGDQPIDYWAPICHGYALAAKDYALFVNALIQRQEGLPVETCFDPQAVTGRDVARVLVDYVDRHPESRDKAVAVVMFAAITEHWCAGFVPHGESSPVPSH